MRKALVCGFGVRLGVLGLLAGCLGHAAWGADDAATAREKLLNSETALEQEGLAPWHLKLDVQTTAVNSANGATGVGGEKGTVEEWYASPSMYRVVYDFPSYKGVVGHDATGYYRSAEFKQVPLQIELARRQVVHPMPTEDELFDYKLDLRKNDFGTGPLECVVISRPKLHDPFPPFGEFPAACIKAGTNDLAVQLGFGREFIPRVSPSTFQKKAVVTDVVAKQNNRPAVVAKVEKLETLPGVSPADYAAPEGAERMSEPMLVPATVAAKEAKHKPTPSVPDRVGAQLIGQEYVARVLVDKTGKVAWVMPVSASTPVLAGPCETAIRGYTYKPFLKDGQPVEALTTVTISY